jgi:glycine betaine catabolism B
MGKAIVEMEIQATNPELADTKTITLRWPQGYEVEFRTGQFITLYWPDEPNYKRAYSLSSCALDRGFFDVTVKREGKMGTRIVDWARPGQKVCVIPPTGRFVPVFEPEKHLVCLAGGSGVTPFRGFAREATRRKLPTRITVLYSVRTEADIIFREEFQEMELANPNFKFFVTCTRLESGHRWTGRCGRISADWLKEHVHNLAQTVFYACGPTEFVEAAEALLLKEVGVPRDQIRTEKWG